jgi:outer membrane protein assembly factor BamB
VTPGSKRLRSYDLDGKLLWELAGMSTIDIPTPFAKHGLLYINSGYPADALRPVYAIRPGAGGDLTLKAGETSNAYIAWSHPTLGSYNPSSLVYGDYYYTLHDRGFITCNDAKTGKEIYGRQRISADSTGFTASPWAYNGRIFALSEDGDTFVLQAGPEFKVLGKNTLGEMTLATPAIAGGSLVVRTAGRLYRIGAA